MWQGCIYLGKNDAVIFSQEIRTWCIGTQIDKTCILQTQPTWRWRSRRLSWASWLTSTCCSTSRGPSRDPAQVARVPSTRATTLRANRGSRSLCKSYLYTKCTNQLFAGHPQWLEKPPSWWLSYLCLHFSLWLLSIIAGNGCMMYLLHVSYLLYTNID